MPTNSSTPPPTTVLLGCSQCGAALPEDTEFCLKCGKSVTQPKAAGFVEVLPSIKLPARRRNRRVVLWLLPVLFLGFLFWALISDNAGAQRIQDLVGMKQDRLILDSSFSVGPHTFRFYKFALPEGSLNVAVVGQFNSAADSQTPGNRKAAATDKNKLGEVDNKIEVYVLTESAFTVWQNGYETSALYESGQVAEGSVQADVPAGAGIYYLVFSNKSSPRISKTVRASVVLRYKSWLPDWFLRMKARVFDWVGID
jgi:hypothetical protein